MACFPGKNLTAFLKVSARINIYLLIDCVVTDRPINTSDDIFKEGFYERWIMGAVPRRIKITSIILPLGRRNEPRTT
jgi:hypothetical protein